MTARRITGLALIEALRGPLGLEGKGIRRIVIDAHHRNIVHIYVDIEGDEALLEFNWHDFIQGEDVVIAMTNQETEG